MSEILYSIFLPFDSITIINVRNGLGNAGFDEIDDALILDSLKDALDFFALIISDPDIPERSLRRCLIRYATYIAYQRYTLQADKGLGTVPESAPLQMQTLLLQTYNCLSMMSDYPLNPDLSINYNLYDAEPYGSLSGSLVVRD